MAKKIAKKQSVNETGKSLKPIFKDGEKAVKSKKALPKLELHYENWPFFEWMDEFEDTTEPVSTDGTFDGNWKRLIDATESDYEKATLTRYEKFIFAATEMAKRLTDFPEVEKIVLFGSLAKPPYRKRLPTRKRIWTFHQPCDIDLAIWLSSLEPLGAMRQTLAMLVKDISKKVPGICDDRIELFVFDSKSSKYLGRVCHYRQCPKQGMECMVEDCGKPKHLKQMPDFKLAPDALTRIHSQLLFERHPTVECSHFNLLADLPKSLPEELIEKLVATKHVRIERIVSTGHSSPPGYWYDQKEHEWVIVLQGHAVLEFENEKRALESGDCVLIPARQQHRVNATSTKEPTVWLAVFFDGTLEGG